MNTASPPAASQTPRTPSILRRGTATIFGLIVAFILNALSLLGPIVMIAWATYTLRGQEFPVPPFVIVVLMLIELWKPTAATQANKKGFVVDMLTGHIEVLIFTVTATLLWDRHVWFGGEDNVEFFVKFLKENWAILFFAVCDDTFVLHNRYVLVFRQSTFMTTDQGHHDHHGAAAGN